MKQLTTIRDGLQFGEITSFSKFLYAVGCSRTTGWRWRSNGWIETVNICGRPYVLRDAIDRFLARAKAGEFSLSPEGKAAASQKQKGELV